MWHAQSISEVLSAFNSGLRGLTSRQVSEAREKYGENRLPEARRQPLWRMFLHQFASPLIFLLLFAALIVFLLGEYVDAAVIVFILGLNSVIGLIQEGRAESALRALRELVTTNSRVIRDEEETIIVDRELVPGDIILLADGDRVPADARLISVASLKVDESALTGESEPVAKQAEVVAGEAVLPADQKNMVFRGSYVIGGSAKAVVVATGLSTLIGQISAKLESLDAEMPLHANIRQLSRLIIVVVFALSAILFGIGVAYGNNAREMFAIVVAIAVSAIPEGLPVVVTLVLATGVSRMVKRQVLVRRLQAVEALGQARVIAVDKTGTVTRNQMMVSRVYANGRFFDVGGSGYDPAGEVRHAGEIVGLGTCPELELLGRTVALSANAAVAFDESKRQWERVSGDPTEAALLVFGHKLGFEKDKLLEAWPVRAEILFDSRHKYHASVNGKFFSVAGAPEVILDQCVNVWRGKSKKFSKEERSQLAAAVGAMTGDGLRVLAVAYSAKAPEVVAPGILPPLTLIGLVGISDGLRAEVPEAVAVAAEAGIRVVMITGDHEETARLIARRAGIYHPGDEVISGADLEGMSLDDLVARIEKASVFARVTPEHKLMIIEAYKKRGEIIAMTGDGVNDALSLAAADLGVAMGKIGTEVAKESADLILLDDNFGNIVKAVEEGRNIYATIKKVVLYLFSTSAGEVLTIAGAILLGLPVPLGASQIVWLNFVTDGFLDVGLSFEPREKKYLRERPAAHRLLLDKLMAWRIILMGGVMMLGSLLVFRHFAAVNIYKASTMALVTMAAFQWFNAWNCRSDQASVFRPGVRLNRPLLAATGAVVVLQLLAVYLPFFQKVLNTVPLLFTDWLLCIGVASSILIVEEGRKLFVRTWRKKPAPTPLNFTPEPLVTG